MNKNKRGNENITIPLVFLGILFILSFIIIILAIVGKIFLNNWLGFIILGMVFGGFIIYIVFGALFQWIYEKIKSKVKKVKGNVRIE